MNKIQSLPLTFKSSTQVQMPIFKLLERATDPYLLRKRQPRRLIALLMIFAKDLKTKLKNLETFRPKTSTDPMRLARCKDYRICSTKFKSTTRT